MNIRMNLDKARDIVETFAAMIRASCDRLEIAGSIRRELPTVKDGEVVVIASPKLWPLLDGMVQGGAITKAEYGESGTHRWGEKYRGIVFRGMNIEIFTTDADNWGYQYWLRTGPGEGNTFIMKWLKGRGQPIQAREGCWWWQGKQLRVPDEQTLFTLLGMHYIPPQIRGEDIYRRETIWNKQHRFPDFSQYVKPEEQPRQLSLLVGGYHWFEEREKPGERELALQAEREYLRQSMALWQRDREVWKRQGMERWWTNAKDKPWLWCMWPEAVQTYRVMHKEQKVA